MRVMSRVVVLLALALALVGTGQAWGLGQAEKAPVLRELTAVKLENVYLRLAAIQRMQQDALADLQRLVVTIETDHPGWTYDVQAQRLVAKPAAPKADAKPDAPAAPKK